MGASTLTGVFVKLPAGALSDLLGRRRLLLAGAIVFAIMPFTYSLLRRWQCSSCWFHGSATAIFGPVASASLFDIAPPASRGAWLKYARRLRAPVKRWDRSSRGISLRQVVSIWRFMTAGVIGLGVPLIVAGWRVAPATSSRRWSWVSSSRASWKLGAIDWCW